MVRQLGEWKKKFLLQAVPLVEVIIHVSLTIFLAGIIFLMREDKQKDITAYFTWQVF